MFRVRTGVGIKVVSRIRERIFLCTLAHIALMNMKAKNAVCTARIHIEGESGHVRNHKGAIPQGIEIHGAVDVRVILASVDESVGFRRASGG